MKSLQPKNNSMNDSTHSPFFQKESRNNFFGGDNKLNSFFNSPSIQTKLTIGQPDDIYEKEADATADKVVQSIHTNNSSVAPVVQTKCATCEEEEKIQKKETEGTEPQQAQTPIANTPAQPQPGKFIVEDTDVPAEGQMRKSEFFERLNAEVCASVDAAMRGTPFSSDNCPYIRAAFARHKNSSPFQLEQLIARYAPMTAFAQSAEGLIQLVKVKVTLAAVQWLATGETPGIDENAQSSPGLLQNISSGIGSIASGIGSMFFKADAGGAQSTQSPASVMQSLGKGNSIDGGSRSKMESAFGTDFSGVEVHTDGKAASLASGMNARAFAVGNHIAFGSGEHKPGTLVGDALMAHELAHTMQQRSGISNPQTKDRESNSVLEQDADNNAVNVMMKLSGREDIQFKDKVKKGLKTGLTISSCKKKSEPKPEPVPPTPAPPTPAPPTPAPIPGCENSRNRDAAVQIISNNPRNYPPTVQMYLHPLQNGELIDTLARDTVADNNVTLAGQLSVELTALNSHINPSRMRVGDCVILLRNWTHPNIGTLPPVPSPDSLTPDVKHTIATVYGEQWHVSANSQEQQKYIWFSIRRRVESSLRGPSLASVVTADEFHAIGQPLYVNALAELNSGNLRTQAVINIRDMVIANWSTALPADAGAFYFHWTDNSTSQTCFTSRANSRIDVDRRERNCAWDWAHRRDWNGSVVRANGWQKRIRGEGDGPIGSMYIYPGF